MTLQAGEFARFCAVGAVGFVVDSGITLALVRSGWASPFVARMIAFVIGASATWLLNRSYTFRSGGGWGRWLLYMGLTSLGALLNVGVYALWVVRFGDASLHILLGILWGACCALAFNFVVSKYIVFVPPTAST